MVQILERPKSFGETFAEGLGQGISSGLTQGLSTAQKLAGTRAKKMEARRKEAGNSFRDVPAYLKNFHDQELRPDELRQLSGIYENLMMQEPDLSKSDALSIALEMYGKSAKGDQQRDSIQSRHKSTAELLGGLGSKAANAIGGYFDPAYQAVKKNPKVLATEAPVALAKLTDRKTAEQDPFGAGVNHLLSQLGITGAPEGSSGKPSSMTNMFARQMRQGMAPEDVEGADRVSDIQSFIGELFTYPKMKGGGGFSAGRSAAKIGSKIAPAEAAAADFSPAKQAIQESSLMGKVTKAPKDATALRMQRTAPQSKMSPVQEIVQQRQKQLKAFPKYEQEIVKDAAEREARRAAKVPKTPVGEAGLKARIAIAEKKLPNIERAYTTATARVRALENQIAKTSGDAKQAYTDLYDVAKKELSEAQIDLQRARSNLRGDSEKYTVEEATKRARAKVDNITDTIAAGKEVKLSGRDYSPRMIAEAKALGKKKKLAHMKGDDFYNQIHEDYLKPYRTRLSEVNADLKSGPIMFNAEGHAALKKEKDVLSKMIESAEAEQTIHNHKLALREINETKKASDRFSTLTKSEKSPKVEKVWKDQFKEAKTPAERGKVIDEGVEQAAKSHPEQAEKIAKEGEKLKSEAESILDKVHGNIPEPKSAKEFAKSIAESIMNFKMAFPQLARYGQEILVGVATGIYDDVKKEYDLPIGSGTIASAVLGRGRDAWIRVLTNQITKKALKKWHVHNAKDQYLSNDPEKRRKWMNQPESVKRKAKKELRGS